jgi:uncharacterized protein YggE
MKKLKLSLFLLGALLIMTACAEAAEIQTASTITVQGASTLEVTPDQAVITLGITNSATTVNEAQTTNAQTASQIEQRLLLAGIHKENLRTAQYSVSPLYTNDHDNKPAAISGYQVNNMLEVTVDDISTIGAIIDAATSAGANQILNIHFTKKDELLLKQTVLKKAVQEATAKAEAIAQAVNKQIVRIVAINENGLSLQSPSRNTYYDMSLKAAAGTPIQPGSLQMHGTVTIVWEIQ